MVDKINHAAAPPPGEDAVSHDPAGRRRLLRAAALAPPLLSGRALAQAPVQPWPDRPVRLVVPFAAGGPVEVPARFIADHLSRRLGQPVVVEPRPGAGGAMGVLSVLQARDGHSFVLTTSSVATLPSMQRNPGFDPLQDLVPVTLVSETPMVILARPDWPVRDLAEFLRRARDGRGRPFTLASSGAGSTTHLAGELLKIRAGIELTHIPYRGSAQSVGGLLAGDTDLLMTGLIEGVPHIREGRLRAIAVTSPARSPALPDTPAIAEAVPGYALPIWYALLAPRGTPDAVVERLAREVAPLRTGSPLAARMEASGAALLLDGPGPLARRMAEEVALWKRVLPAAGIHPE